MIEGNTQLGTIVIAFISGVIPTLVWLWFWTREDKENPEPKNMIALAFLGGMIAVVISLFLEKYFYGFGLKNLFSSGIFSHILPWFQSIATKTGITIDKVLLVMIVAPIIEELSKFVLAYILVLRSKEDDEPLDPMIYMITTALGFAAIENMLFLIDPISKQNVIASINNGDMRFIGATLLHTISSATIALFISYNFFDKKVEKTVYTVLGIIVAVFVHGAFNYFMLGNQGASVTALELIWIIVIILLLAFEKIKKIRKENSL